MATEEQIRAWLEANYADGGWTLTGNHTLAWIDNDIQFRPGIEYIIGKINETLNGSPTA